jgi:hypothetical protein
MSCYLTHWVTQALQLPNSLSHPGPKCYKTFEYTICTFTLNNLNYSAVCINNGYSVLSNYFSSMSTKRSHSLWDWLIDWLAFNVRFSSMSAISVYVIGALGFKITLGSSGKLPILAQPWPNFYCFTTIKPLSDGMCLTTKQWENIMLR